MMVPLMGGVFLIENNYHIGALFCTLSHQEPLRENGKNYQISDYIIFIQGLSILEVCESFIALQTELSMI